MSMYYELCMKSVVFLCAATADARPVDVTALSEWSWVTFHLTHTAEMRLPNYTWTIPPPAVVSALPQRLARLF